MLCGLRSVVCCQLAFKFAEKRINSPQKRRQRFPRTGGREDERVFAALNRKPTLRLGGGGFAKGRAEPSARDLRKIFEGIFSGQSIIE